MNLFILTHHGLSASNLTDPENLEWSGSHFYASSTHARVNVQHYPDRHVVKMILESAQIVMTAINIRAEAGDRQAWRVLEGMATHWEFDTYPRPCTGGHRKHPVIVWAAKEWHHIEYVRNTLAHLCGEYTTRYGRIHAYQPMHRRLADWMFKHGIPTSRVHAASLQPTYFPLCANSELDTKKVGAYIKSTRVGITYLVAAQRLNFILNKPWAVDNYNRAKAAMRGVPYWYSDVGLTSQVAILAQVEILANDILSDRALYLQPVQ